MCARNLLLIFGAVATLTPSSAMASGCTNPKYAKIAFTKGSRCWTYQGNATHFRGTFRRGQTIIASSTGVANFADREWEWRTTEARGLSATTPKGKSIVLNNGERGQRFVTPDTGVYVFEFIPCAMWGGLGVFVLCAK